MLAILTWTKAYGWRDHRPQQSIIIVFSKWLCCQIAY